MTLFFQDEHLRDNDITKFREILWRPWLENRYSLDILFCKILRPICPDEMSRSFTLATCQMLGTRLQVSSEYTLANKSLNEYGE